MYLGNSLQANILQLKFAELIMGTNSNWEGKDKFGNQIT